MTKICYLCKKGEIVHDKKMSGLFCTGCGECFELGSFTDEVQYREDEKGRYMAVGTTYNVEKGFVNSKFINHAQILTSVGNAKTILKRYCDKLYISGSFADISAGFYHQLLIKKFMNGRRLNVVLAACLYIAVRSNGANVILLDISDVAEANVYDIGRYYFQIIRILHFNIQTVDPCEYIVRFVDMLNLGDRNLPQVKRMALSVRDTANLLVQRMKRDWIHYGRRPSGVCAAAVLVAARINNVRCSIKDIISIAKVCESTIRKRINEFIETPSSQLTYKEFLIQDLDKEEDPPCYKFNNSTMKDAVEANLGKVEKYQEIIEEHLKDSRAKLRGVYAKFLKEILKAQDEKTVKVDDENEIIQEAIIDQNILALEDKIVSKMSQDMKWNDDKGNPSTEEIEYWSEFRPSAQSLGLLKREQTETNAKSDYEDLLDKNLDDMNDEEIDAYLVNDPREISQRQMEWNILNQDYLEKEEKEMIKRSLQDNENEQPENSKSKNKKRKNDKKPKIEPKIEASSTSEAVEAACKAKSISLNDINLKELFNEEGTSTSDSSNSQQSANKNTIDQTKILKYNENIENAKQNKNKEDPRLVSLYHSYAMKVANEESTTNEEKSTEDPKKEQENISNKTPSQSNSRDIYNDDDDITYDEELEDYEDYIDDEDDELQKIKIKYSIQRDGQHEDIEDCGF